ncbi:MAG: hypothetical protein HYY40_10270 [Bacteroidetes bacterium]|nr:hypothetical protein [Bacteroidota bacterium]
MKKIDCSAFNNVKFGKNVTIEADVCKIFPGSVIEDNVIINARKIVIGYDSVIQKGTIARGLREEMKLFEIGDNAFIGFSNQVLVPVFIMKDYSQLHNSGLHSGYKPLTIGFNCWIGQQSILNSTETLTIGNNVRIGTHSQLWTHVASGELLEGCTLFGELPLNIMDNVWIVGGAVISPGLTVERNSIIMTGSVLTKNTEPFHTYAGIPAKDITGKLSCWKKVTGKDKINMMKIFINEFLSVFPKYKKNVLLKTDTCMGTEKTNEDKIMIGYNIAGMGKLKKNRISYFDMESKLYTKKRTAIEIDFIKFNLGYRARFIPCR